MKPVDIRNENWADIEARVEGSRREVHAAALRFGGAWTTRSLAAAMNRDVLTVRPRVSELALLGLVDCVGRDGKDGLYVGVPAAHARDRFEGLKSKAAAEQMFLKV